MKRHVGSYRQVVERVADEHEFVYAIPVLDHRFESGTVGWFILCLDGGIAASENNVVGVVRVWI